MIGRKRRDAGQVFPIYMMMVAFLLLLAFAFFAVGKAAALRNEAQGAADAAALAAAQKTREDFEAPFLASLPEDVLDLFLQNHMVTGCPAAHSMASANNARVVDGGCTWSHSGYRDRITVEVEGRKAVDSSVLEGSEETKAKAEATAIVEFRCSWRSVDLNDDSIRDIFFFTCKGGEFLEIRPSSPPPWDRVSKILFDVRLVEN
ncbi:pilus assembly protein TadG-related protein [Streptomyces sp. NPDC047987]|uniref:pilus assembly protein TadG-related protein n=1 Tax=unclassified Streptomyces TaxID=2593676 RepID=UPI003445E460